MDNQQLAEKCITIAKELMDDKITVVNTLDEPPENFTKSIFLAGPSPRDKNTPSWRPEALKEIEAQGFEGVVFYPEFPEGAENKYENYYHECLEWERRSMEMSDCILFWVPRVLENNKMLGLTTNVEFGTWINSDKTVFGFPEDAEKNSYLEWLNGKVTNQPTFHTLIETVNAALIKIGQGAERTGAERKIPLQIWNTPQFQHWYSNLINNGNRLEDARQLWVFKAPRQQKVFSFVLWVKIWIEREKRYKSNEWIFSRSNISSVVLYDGSPQADFRDTRVVIVKEFRSPVNNEEGMVYECPGGSSFSGKNPFECATSEVKEETGIEIPANRFVKVSSRQIAATLTTHYADVYAVALTKEEMDKIIPLTNINEYFGCANDTEQTYVKVFTIRQLLHEEIPIDWANLGIILCTVLGGYRAKNE